MSFVSLSCKLFNQRVVLGTLPTNLQVVSEVRMALGTVHSNVVVDPNSLQWIIKMIDEMLGR